MDRFADIVIKRRKLIIVIFLLASLAGAVLQATVVVNYNMVDYLPEASQSTKALELMEAEFDTAMPNASVMVKDVSVQQALEYKRQLEAVEGVTDVMWLDDAVDIKQPIEVLDKDTVESFYKDNMALFSVTIADGVEAEASEDIWAIIGDDNALAGDAPNSANMQGAAIGEVLNAVAIIVPVALVILAFALSSWIEPLLILASIGVSILINMGTNVIFGSVSFITNSVSPILQLAVAMDYGIFLLHSFEDFRKKYDDPEKAMKEAIKDSVTTVSASALTTFFGFLALAFMQFGIGADLGLNLVKGIVLSFISSMVFLPAITLALIKVVDKTHHRQLFVGLKNVNKIFSKLAIPSLLIVAVIVVPAFLGQGQTGFIYGSSGIEIAGPRGEADQRITDSFGKSTVMALLVPRGDIAKEWELGNELEELDHVNSVVSYASSVGTVFPAEFVGESVTSQFYSDNYARLVVYTDTPDEGDLAFNTVEQITAKAKEHYGDAVYSAGQAANLYDMRTVVARDNTVVTLIAVVAIFLVLLGTFRSATLPIILLLTIETGIWLNLSIPYFTGTQINFIGYLVLNTVQLGATVDYAILLTDTYLKKRRELPQKQAMDEAMGSAFKSMIVSAFILSMAGFTLYATSTNPGVMDIGLLLGRGTILSFVMVVCFLPGMLRVLDKPINKTTYKARFYYDKTTSDLEAEK